MPFENESLKGSWKIWSLFQTIFNLSSWL
jgi:hypothetical protein